MSRCDMQGHATTNELLSLYLELIEMTEEERKAKPFCLFVASKGFLNGQEAYEYIKNKMEAMD